MKNKIAQLSLDLCSISSITSHESEVMAYMATWLVERGLIVKKIQLDDKRFNIFAYFTERPIYSTIFCTHLDTVSPFVAPRMDEEQNLLWGRGSCDAKGIAAAMVFAALEQRSLGHDDLALLFTVDEEESSAGAKVANGRLKGRGRYVVVGEPTDLKAAFAQKGSLVFDLLASGIEGHSALPHSGDSAIHRLVQSVELLLKHPWARDDRFGETLLNIGEISGGLARNIFAPHAIAKAVMRLAQSVDEVMSVIRPLLSRGVKIDVKSQADPFLYAVPQGFDTFLAAFGSDAPYLRDIGQPMLIGPGSLDHAHKLDERVAIDELFAGYLAYQKIAKQLRGSI